MKSALEHECVGLVQWKGLGGTENEWGSVSRTLVDASPMLRKKIGEVEKLPARRAKETAQAQAAPKL